MEVASKSNSVREEAENGAELMKGRADVVNSLFAFTETLALRSAIELRIADIIHSHGNPTLSLSGLASKIEAPSPEVTFLARVMRMLVRKNIFTVDYPNITDQSSEEPEPVYGLTTASTLLLHDHEHSLASTFLFYSHPNIVKPCFEISGSIKEGGTDPFVMAHGETSWEMMSRDLEFNELFNVGMGCVTKPTLEGVIKGYREGFGQLQGTLVDVAGGIGKLVAKIVEAYPRINGINFDQAHVVANAPQYPGVTHVGGDVFHQDIPSADNVIIKSVLHNWADEDCLKILGKCQKAVSQKKGKVIVVEIILHPDRREMFDDASVALDLVMMTACIGGRERTETQWRKLLKEAGFAQINIIPLNTMMPYSVIEAFLP